MSPADSSGKREREELHMVESLVAANDDGIIAERTTAGEALLREHAGLA